MSSPTKDPMSLKFIIHDLSPESSNPDDLHHRSPLSRPHNYYRIWESSSLNLTASPKNVCHPPYSNIIGEHGNEEGGSTSIMPKTPLNTAEMVSSPKGAPPTQPADSDLDIQVDHPAMPPLPPAPWIFTDSIEGYICTICNRVFTTTHQLENHMTSRVHMVKLANQATYGVGEVKCSRCSFSSESPEAVVIHYMHDHTEMLSTVEDPESYTSIALNDPTEGDLSPTVTSAPSESSHTSASSFNDNPSDSTSIAPNLHPEPDISRAEAKQPINRPASIPPPKLNLPLVFKFTTPRRPSKPSSSQKHRQPQAIECEDGAFRYPCEVCKCTINRLGDLSRHNKSTKHRKACGLKPVRFECSRCKVKFSRKDALTRHLSKICD